MVLKVRQDDFVAGAEVRPRPCVRDEVDRFRRAPCENNLLVALRIQKAGNLAAHVFVDISRFLRQRMHAAMHVCIVLLVELDERLDHLNRLLRGRGVIQVHERVAVNRSLQDGKVAADPLDIEHSLALLSCSARSPGRRISRRREPPPHIYAPVSLRAGSAVCRCERRTGRRGAGTRS